MTHVFDLMVAPNGARLGKGDHPALPITATEVADAAEACEAAGATAIHVHVRDQGGGHSLDPDRYAETVAQIRARTALSVQISTEAVGIYDVATQARCLMRAPSSDASVALREIARDVDALSRVYGDAHARGISVQHILYDPIDLRALLEHFDNGVIPEGDRRALFVLGRYAENQVSTPDDLTPFLDALGTVPLRWSVCAFGPQEHECLLAALKAGGHVRIGFENNRTAADGTPYADNAASVATFVQSAAKHGFTPGKVSS